MRIAKTDELTQALRSAGWRPRYSGPVRRLAAAALVGAALTVAGGGLVACSPSTSAAPAAASQAAPASQGTPGARQDGGQFASSQSLRTKLGLNARTLTSDVAQSLGISATEGAYVVQVYSDGPAGKAGVKGAMTTAGTGPQDGQGQGQGQGRPQGTPGPRRQGQGQAQGQGAPPANGTPRAIPTPAKGGDLIVAVDGQKVAKVEDLSGYLDSKKSGDAVHLTVLRDGQNQTIDVVLGS